MHRFAVGDPQCIRHQLFAELRIRMVDGEAVRQSFIRGAAAALVGSVAAIVVGMAGSGAVFMSGFPSASARQARGSATRRRSLAAARRCNFNGG